LHPNRSCRSICFRDSVRTLADLLSVVPATGIAPASIRLEGGGLSFSATRRKNWCPWQDSHLHYAAFEARPTIICRQGQDVASRRSAGQQNTRNTAFEARHDCVFHHARIKNGPPARNCTWNSVFAEPCDGSFTTGRKKEPNSVRLRQKLRGHPSSGMASTSWTSASGSRSSFCMISNTRSLQPERQ
jgi:hypothetical protein